MKKRRPSKQPPPAPRVAVAPAPASPPVSTTRIALGITFLLLAMATALILVLEHLGGIALPGCGPGSACAELARGKWGKVPGVNWPVSFVGLAYFVGALVAWLASRRGVSTGLRYLVRLGAVFSLGFVVLMLAEKHFCQYCLGAHLGNFAFWIVLESTRTPAAQSLRALATMGSVFVLVSLPLGFAQWRTRAAMQQRGQELAAEDTAKMIEVTRRAQATTAPTTGTAAPPSGVAHASQPSAADDYPYQGGFRGRYVYGPAEAAVRIVMFTDYQCVDCQRVEREVRGLLARHKDVSLSVKHFPFNKECNPTVDHDLHSNACWAARAAETAGLLYGNDGFWAMHLWLFDHKGVFTTRHELENAVRSLGYDPAGFVKRMMSDETLQLVQADIREARQLGLFQTPMIFINGVELRGWYAEDAVVRAVEAVLAQNPRPLTHAVDHPPLASGKVVGDWREQPVRQIPPDQVRWPLGPDDAPAKIVVFSDYQVPNTAESDAVIRRWIAGRTDAQYTFRHYPFNRDCNPNVSSTKSERGCWAARAAEAAGRLGGVEGYWRMHAWLLSHQQSFTDEALREAAGELGFEPDALLAAMSSPEVEAAIRDDVDAGAKINLSAIPSILVNGRIIARWGYLGPERGREIITGILNAATTGE